MTISTPIDTPDWVKDAVFYQIFPDRFARNDEIIKPNNLQPWAHRPNQKATRAATCWVWLSAWITWTS
jgi:hypothetical protein